MSRITFSDEDSTLVWQTADYGIVILRKSAKVNQALIELYVA